MAKRRKKKRKKSKDKKFIGFRNKLRKYKNPKDAIYFIKIKSSDSELKTHLKELSEVVIYKKLILADPFPHEISSLKQTPCLIYSHIDRELYWSSIILSIFKEEINSFLLMKANFEFNLLTQQFDKALSSLKRIENEYGYSLWLIESYFSLFQEYYGLEKQKEYCQKLSGNQSISGIVRYLSYLYSVRSEPNVSFELYDEIIKNTNKETDKFRHEYSQYLLFKANSFATINIENYLSILFYESNSSIIDRYLTFNRIIHLLLSNNPTKDIVDSCTKCLSSLVGKINDKKIINLAYLLDLRTHVFIDSTSRGVIKILDNYTIGNYQKSIDLCKSLLLKDPSLIEVYEILVKSAVRLKKYDSISVKSKFQSKILNYLLDLIVTNNKAHESSIDLLKIISVNPLTSWATQLYSLVTKEKAAVVDLSNNSTSTLSELNSYPSNPRLSTIFHNDKAARKYLSRLRDIYEESPTINLLDSLFVPVPKSSTLIDSIGLPSSRLLKYKAINLIKIGEYKPSIEILSNLLKSQDPLIAIDSICLNIKCFMLTNQLEECINITVDSYLTNNNLYLKLPIKEIISLLEDNKHSVSNKNIAIAIIYDIYSNWIDRDRDFKKFIAHEDFLIENGLRKPSEIIPLIDNFDRPKLIYFLKNICIPQVMDSSEFYESTEEVEQERIKVCQILRDIDSDNDIIYYDEIKSITQKLWINKGLRAIEGSKIYVDVEGIKKSIEKKLRESYNRYINLISKTDISDDANYVTIEINKELGYEIRLPSSEKSNLFFRMVETIRDEFVSSNEHGLDGYLSVGIRHGTLSGQLRGPLESANLITQKGSSGVYLDNEYMRELYYHIDEEIISELDNRLKRFSQDIDLLIELLKKRWIQIVTEKKPTQGLFDFTIALDDYEQLQFGISPETKYEEFLEIIFQYLWSLTEKSLKKIRHHISTTLKTGFNRIFQELLKEIENITPNYSFPELTASITTLNTTIQYELDKIANWFRRTRSPEIDSYSIDLAFDIGIEMIKNIYPNNKLSINKSIHMGKALKGDTLRGLVDIIFILFDNIIKHSKIQNGATNVLITSSNNSGKLCLEIKNDVSEQYNIKLQKYKIEKLKRFINKAKFLDKVKIEGGTGFYKIKKIIDFDLGCKHTINFYYTDDYNFNVVIEIDSKWINA